MKRAACGREGGGASSPPTPRSEPAKLRDALAATVLPWSGSLWQLTLASRSLPWPRKKSSNRRAFLFVLLALLLVRLVLLVHVLHVVVLERERHSCLLGLGDRRLEEPLAVPDRRLDDVDLTCAAGREKGSAPANKGRGREEEREGRTSSVHVDHLRDLGPHALGRRTRRALSQRVQLALEHALERVEHIELVLPAEEPDRLLPRGRLAAARLDLVELVRLRDEKAHLGEQLGRELAAAGHEMAQVVELERMEEVEEGGGARRREGELERVEVGRVRGQDEAVAEEELLVRLGAVRVEDLLLCCGDESQLESRRERERESARDARAGTSSSSTIVKLPLSPAPSPDATSA